MDAVLCLGSWDTHVCWQTIWCSGTTLTLEILCIIYGLSVWGICSLASACSLKMSNWGLSGREPFLPPGQYFWWKFSNYNSDFILAFKLLPVLKKCQVEIWPMMVMKSESKTWHLIGKFTLAAIQESKWANDPMDGYQYILVSWSTCVNILVSWSTIIKITA